MIPDWWHRRGKGPKTVFLHIGAHKTGTSTIQSMLKAESSRLRRHGFHYEPGFYALGRTLKYESPLSPAVRHSLRQEIRSRIEPRRERYIIGSSEHFFGDVFKSYSNIRAVAEEVRAILVDYDVRIIACIRRQDEFVQSVYQQHVKEGGTMRFEAFIASHDVHGYRWNELLGQYADVFGRSQMRVHCYEDVFAEQGRLLEHVFEPLAAAGFRAAHLASHVNPGLSDKGIEIAVRCNDLLSAEERRRLRQFLQQTFGRQPGDDHSLLSPDQRRTLMMSYAESNRRCLQEYCRGSARALEYLPAESESCGTSNAV